MSDTRCQTRMHEVLGGGVMDFRRVDIAKQKAYDLLRDWIKLVARHTNPDQDISELLGWLWKLKPATPDPATGLVPCGCGGRLKRMNCSDTTAALT